MCMQSLKVINFSQLSTDNKIIFLEIKSFLICLCSNLGVLYGIVINYRFHNFTICLKNVFIISKKVGFNTIFMC